MNNKVIVYECPQCDYLDSDKDVAESHCLDDRGTFW